MTAYELSRLNDKEFEVLAAHIVQEFIGMTVERFKPGKDKGVDGRFFVAGVAEGIMQAKHWEGSGLAALLTHLEAKEAPKVKKLLPERYILMTSVPLSRVNKQRIKKIFEPFLKTESDIFGNEDIQDFLREHSKIVEKHYKLWLASAEVLRLIFSAPIIGRSSFKLADATAFARKYVPTKCHQEALARLKSTGVIIIIGEPGIGKSTLAEQLVLHYAVEGYELCFIESALSEAEGVWANERKQVFYFDDFLGRNYLDAIGGNHDSHVLNFIRRVGKDKSKRFILTSRTTIMQQGKRLSDLFRTHNINQKEYEIRVTDLSALEKARILYNHIWFGDLAPEFVEQLYVDKRYKSVVAHQNFNPRLIAFITDSHKIAGISAEKYWIYIVSTLENPREIWRGVFENQLDRMGRLIVALVVFHGGQISERHLRESCDRARVDELPVSSPAEWSLNFERSYQISVGAVITRMVERFGGETSVGLFNPSVGDFVLRQFARDVASLESFFALLMDHRPLGHFKAARKSGIVGDHTYRAVMRKLAIRFWAQPLGSPGFSSTLASFVVGDPILLADLENELVLLSRQFFEIADASANPEEATAFAIYSVEKKLIANADARWLAFNQSVIEHTTLDEDLVELSDLLVLLDGSVGEEAISDLALHVVECWKENIAESIAENDVATDNLDDETSHDEVKREITKFVRQSLADYAFEFGESEIAKIIAEYDIYDHISDHRRPSSYDDEGGGRGYSGGGGGGSEQEQIDDLFERDR